MSHHGSWDDEAYAEEHDFTSVGFVDSPLIAGDPFVAMALTAERTSTLRIGTMLAIPGNRNAATCATAIATVNRLAPGRAFLIPIYVAADGPRARRVAGTRVPAVAARARPRGSRRDAALPRLRRQPGDRRQGHHAWMPLPRRDLAGVGLVIDTGACQDWPDTHPPVNPAFSA
jgi:hypothetical protein